MKRFHFPLQQLLSWRRIQCEMEEAKLEKLIGEQLALRDQRRGLAQQELKERGRLSAGRSSSATDLVALAGWLRFAQEEHKRLEAADQAMEDPITKQRVAVRVARQRMELLDQYRDQSRQTWQREIEAEQDKQVEELVVSRWKKRQP